MAIIANYETEYGFTQPNAYTKINNFSGNKEVVNFDTLTYVDEQARILGKTFIGQHYHSVPYSDGMSIAMLYAHLKTLPEFPNAVDAL